MNQAKFFGLIVVATAALLLSDNTVISQTGGVCSGKLVKEKDGTLTLVDGEVICEVDPGGTQGGPGGMCRRPRLPGDRKKVSLRRFRRV